MREYVVTDPETLRELCIKNNWFTCGSNSQYEKMFAVNSAPLEGIVSWTLSDVATIIWICSGDVPRGEIHDKLQEAQDNYLATLRGNI